MTELPLRFQERMKGLLGEEYPAFEAGYEKERVQGLRFSRLKLGLGESGLLQDREGESLARCTAEDSGREGLAQSPSRDSERESLSQGPSQHCEREIPSQSPPHHSEGESWAQRLAAQAGRRAGFTLTPVPWAAEGFYYQSQDRPGRHPYHEAGLYYIQEPSAMAVTELLDPLPGDLVLDLCGAPGGKSTHIASRLGGEGFLLSNEIHPVRAKILSQNIERMGVRNSVVCNEEPGRLAPRFPGFFHKILVDAPCSGEGMFRKEEEAQSQWSEDHVKMCARRQAEILDCAALMLKPGGRMVYSTCTFAPEENEGTIMGFLERHREFRLEEAVPCEGFTPGNPRWALYGQDKECSAGDESRLSELHLERTVRLMPHKLEGEGHFIAVLKKGELSPSVEGESRKKAFPGYLSQRKGGDWLKDYERFIRETMTRPEAFLGRQEYVLFGDQLYLVPPQMPDFAGLKVLRPGLHMGTLKKNRFEPSHALALALSPGEVKAFRDLPSQGSQVFRYLRGESPAPREDAVPGREVEKGWILICTDGYSLGWCKMAGGILKNHYPRGLRWS